MSQLQINMMFGISLFALAVFALNLESKNGVLTVKDLEYPRVDRSSDACNSLQKILKTAPDQFALLMNSLDGMFKTYQKDAKANTCLLCKTNAVPECKNDDIARWVFNNCP